jgi:hypothetical protein
MRKSAAKARPFDRLSAQVYGTEELWLAKRNVAEERRSRTGLFLPPPATRKTCTPDNARINGAHL